MPDFITDIMHLDAKFSYVSYEKTEKIMNKSEIEKTLTEINSPYRKRK